MATIKDTRIKLRSLIDGLVSDTLLNQVGQEVALMVKTRTRKGFGVPVDLGPQTRLPGLSESYKKQRKRLQSQGRLSPDTTPGKSNLTKTGDLLNNIEYKVSNNTVTVSPDTDDRKKAKHQADAGRIAFNLSKSENSKIKKIIDEKIKNDIKKQGL